MYSIQTALVRSFLAAFILLLVGCGPTVSTSGEFTHPDCAKCVFPVPIGSTIYGKDKMARFRVEAPSDLEFSEVNDFYIEKLGEYGWTFELHEDSAEWWEYYVTDGQHRFTLFVTQTDSGRPVEISMRR